MCSTGTSDSHNVANTNAQNAVFQSLLSIIITFRKHHIGYSANRLCGHGDAGSDHRDSGISDSHHGTGLKGHDDAGRDDQFEAEYGSLHRSLKKGYGGSVKPVHYRYGTVANRPLM